MEKFLKKIKFFIPKSLFSLAQPAYHYLLAFWGAVSYSFPSRHLYVVGVTGTKGKTSTSELTAAILEEAGFRVALANTNRFKLADYVEKNLTKRSMLGRTRLQQFLRSAVDAKCDYAVIEMTSEGAKQFRHKFLDLDALIFTNLSPEHIESHGSYEKYVDAKVSLARALESGNAKKHTIVANRDDVESKKFLSVNVGTRCEYGIDDARPFSTSTGGSEMTWRNLPIRLQIPGEFNILNALGAATFAESRGVKIESIKNALEKFSLVRGRMEKIDQGQDFSVIVDYAHTADSLDRAYSVYNGVKKICIIGGTGGGRDVAKRKVMGGITDKHCEHIILTTEDPYDEDPEDIANDVASGIKNHSHEFILDRREAMSRAFQMAKKGWVVFMTGKGAGPYIMGRSGLRTPWDDATVAREELQKLGFKKQ
ncbi:MAG: UDP-N-acetylmuramyl-tripeptide synthetase [Candidatus Yonathbacteria bacterium]|nr:UDP-N-acetylmuramyl-tripeptide synthetase [Candidatus Yonathbacteria bacterium]